jgi:hypothetical protein
VGLAHRLHTFNFTLKIFRTHTHDQPIVDQICTPEDRLYRSLTPAIGLIRRINSEVIGLNDLRTISTSSIEVLSIIVHAKGFNVRKFPLILYRSFCFMCDYYYYLQLRFQNAIQTQIPPSHTNIELHCTIA